MIPSELKFAIIVPVYNTAKYLRECLDSVLSQTHKNFTLFAVDDGSIDESGKILDAYAIKDSRFKVTHKENEGVSIARNTALKLIEAENDFDFIAASFIRKPQDVIDMRNYINSVGENRIKIISKIENQEGLDNFDEILKVTDGIMVARGDLGVEIPEEDVPAAQKMMIKKTVAAGKPVITATQMLESMQKNPRPTRAEVSDVANAVYDGTSATMLSGESAQGDYPIEAVKTMNKIIEASEKNINYWKRFKKKNIEKLTTFERADLSDSLEFKRQANFSVCCSAMFSNADAIIAVSEHGVTPALLSSYKPECPIFVITANEKTYRQFAVEYGIIPILIPGVYDFNKILTQGIEMLKEKGYLKVNDTVVLSGGLNTESGEYLSTQATGAIMKIQ